MRGPALPDGEPGRPVRRRRPVDDGARRRGRAGRRGLAAARAGRRAHAPRRGGTGGPARRAAAPRGPAPARCLRRDDDPLTRAGAAIRPAKDWYVGGASAHGRLSAAAAEAGVTILAGTDSRPHGRVADEIRALAAAGLRPHDALAAGSWAARAYLGQPGMAEGAPADAVVYDSDPRADLGQLDHPRAVILRGQLLYSRERGRALQQLADVEVEAVLGDRLAEHLGLDLADAGPAGSAPPG